MQDDDLMMHPVLLGLTFSPSPRCRVPIAQPRRKRGDKDERPTARRAKWSAPYIRVLVKSRSMRQSSQSSMHVSPQLERARGSVRSIDSRPPEKTPTCARAARCMVSVQKSKRRERPAQLLRDDACGAVRWRLTTRGMSRKSRSVARARACVLHLENAPTAVGSRSRSVFHGHSAGSSCYQLV
jgi:hypothetical protein